MPPIAVTSPHFSLHDVNNTRKYKNSSLYWLNPNTWYMSVLLTSTVNMSVQDSPSFEPWIVAGTVVEFPMILTTLIEVGYGNL